MVEGHQVKSTLLSRKPKPTAGGVALLSILVLYVFCQLYWQRRFNLTYQLPAIPERVFEHGEYWRLFTAIGAHSGWGHFFSNVPLFGVLAFLLYGYFGWLVYPVITLLLGAGVNYLSLLTYPEKTQLIGASGVVYLMAGAWLTLSFLIDRRFSIPKRVLRTLGFAGLFFIPTTFKPEVSYRTHAIGFGVGIVFAVAYFLFNRKKIRQLEVIERDEELLPFFNQ